MKLVRLALLPPVIFALTFGLLLQVPGARHVYSTVYRASANLAFGSFGEGTVLVRKSSTKHPGGGDTTIVFSKESADAARRRPINARLKGFVPFALFLSVAAASLVAIPLSWSRRLLMFGIGVVAVHAFLVLRLIALIVLMFSQGGPEIALFQPSPFVLKVMAQAYNVLWESTLTDYGAPLAIWLAIVLFFLAGPSKKASSPQPPASSLQSALGSLWK